MVSSTSYLWAGITAVSEDIRLTVLAASIVSLLVWRFYTFTLRPWLHPTEPKEYPYWIPVVGHLRSFFKNSSKLISEARACFGDTGEPFALSVAGQRWYVVTNAEDVSATYKLEHLSYDVFAIEVMRMIGVSEDGISKAFRTEGHAENKHLVRLCKEYQLEQLSPGGRLEQLVEPSVDLIRHHLNTDTILSRGRNWYSAANPDGSLSVSLYQWISDVFIDLGTQAYFDPRIYDVEPDLIRTFMSFETLSWQAMYQYPSFLCSEMIQAKLKLQNAMLAYFAPSTASSKTSTSDDQTSWFIRQIESETAHLSISPPDAAIFFFQLFWSINGNTRKAPFWILSYLLCQAPPSLLPSIRAEILPFIGTDHNRIDIPSLLSPQSCPLLNALWDETIRLTAFAASVRFLTDDIVLAGKTLRKGGRLMMPQRQLHFDPRYFGPTAAEFNPDRFREDPGLRRHPSLRPFGGGTTMCPGRNLAKQTSLIFVALVLARFEVELEGDGQEMPRAAEGKPSIGLVDVEEGCDLRVRLRVRGAGEK